jgi:hypothetical protein
MSIKNICSKLVIVAAVLAGVFLSNRSMFREL